MCEVTLETGGTYPFGPRPDPFDHKPYALLLSREQIVRFSATEESLIAVGISPAKAAFPDLNLKLDDVRGSDNWSRSVRFVIWADNSEGNQLVPNNEVYFSSFPNLKGTV